MIKRNQLIGLAFVIVLLVLGGAALWFAPGSQPPPPKKAVRSGPPIYDEIPFEANKRQGGAAFSGATPKATKEKSLRELLAERAKGEALKNMSKESWQELGELFPEQMQTVAGCVALAGRDAEICDRVSSPRPYCRDLIVVASYLFAKEDQNGLKGIWPSTMHADIERMFKKDKNACQEIKKRTGFYLLCMLNARAPEEVNDPDNAEFTKPFTAASPELVNLRDGQMIKKLPVDYQRQLDLLKKAVGGDEAICKELF